MKSKRIVPEEGTDVEIISSIKKKEILEKPWLLEKTLDNENWEHHWWHAFVSSEAALAEMNALCKAAYIKTSKPIPNLYYTKAKAWRLRNDNTGDILNLKLNDNVVSITVK